MSSVQISNRLLPLSLFGKTMAIASRINSYNYSRSFHFSSVLINNPWKGEKSVVDINEQYDKQMYRSLKIVLSNASLITTSSSKCQLLWQRIIHESKHYYRGCKLLFTETKIAFRLGWQMLNGQTLTRRERKQFTRTMVDLFRLLPFSIFIIVPFMEFTLPIFLKVFPNMLPSTFKQIETITKSHTSCSKPIQSFNVQPSIEGILQFSSLFANQLTLNNLSRPQLIALCKLLNLSTMGPHFYLRWKLYLKFHRLKIDDKLIANEGLENLTNEELRTACHERGMSSLDISIEQLQSQLQLWFDLHIHKQIPITILLLSNVITKTPMG